MYCIMVWVIVVAVASKERPSIYIISLIFCSMMRIIGKLQEALPGVFIHSVRIGKTPEDDRKRSLIDNMNRQIEEVCQQLAQIPELSNGFNAIGISQVKIAKYLFYIYFY